jgi:hypothetical protein
MDLLGSVPEYLILHHTWARGVPLIFALLHKTTTYDFQIVLGYKVTTYNIIAHKVLEKTFHLMAGKTYSEVDQGASIRAGWGS